MVVHGMVVRAGGTRAAGAVRVARRLLCAVPLVLGLGLLPASPALADNQAGQSNVPPS